MPSDTKTGGSFLTILFVWLEGNASDLMAEFVLLASFQLKNKIVKMHDEKGSCKLDTEDLTQKKKSTDMSKVNFYV